VIGESGCSGRIEAATRRNCVRSHVATFARTCLGGTRSARLEPGTSRRDLRRNWRGDVPSPCETEAAPIHATTSIGFSTVIREPFRASVSIRNGAVSLHASANRNSGELRHRSVASCSLAQTRSCERGYLGRDVPRERPALQHVLTNVATAPRGTPAPKGRSCERRYFRRVTGIVELDAIPPRGPTFPNTGSARNSNRTSLLSRHARNGRCESAP
jgi:hypothetical protein